MHVALALFRHFPHGGMQRDLLATAERCVSAGHDVTIHCHTWQGPAPMAPVRLAVLPVRGSTNHARARRFAARLRQRLLQAPADVVIGFDKMPGLDLYFAADRCFVARTARRPWVYRVTPRYRTLRALEAAVFATGSPTRILLLDERQRTDYQSVWHTEAERFVLLPPGIARDRRRGADAEALRASARSEFGIGPDDHLLLLLAANFELKGLDRVLRAVAQQPSAQRERTHVLAVGQEPPPKLRQLATQLGIAGRVTMLPGRDDVPRLLQAADLLVHPARHDTTGTVLLEALLAGLPVICSNACGYAHHVAAAAAGRVLSEPFVQQEFDRALDELLAGDREPLCARGLAYGERHDLHSMHDRVLAEIEAVGRERRQRGRVTTRAARSPT